MVGVIQSFQAFEIIAKGGLWKVRIGKVVIDGEEQVVALKQFPKKLIIDKNYIQFMHREKGMASILDNAFVVRFMGTVQDSRYCYIVYEFCIGGGLDNRLLVWHYIPHDASLFYITQLMIAIQYLHQNNVIHRDIQPSSIWITQQGQIKLTNFHNAICVQNDQKCITKCTTQDYMSPEMLQSKGHSFPTDYWSLGILIFEIWVGYTPFYNENPLQVMNSIIDTEPIYPEFLSIDQIDLVQRLLNKNPNLRLGTNGMEEMMIHSWFYGVDFQDVQRQQIPPPWTPQTFQNDDTQYYNCFSDFSDPPSPVTRKLFENF